MSNRKFAIKILNSEHNYNYIREIFENENGYFFITTNKITNAKTWNYKKNCEKSIYKIYLNINISKYSNYEFEIEEITNIKILRKLKSNKLRKL